MAYVTGRKLPATLCSADIVVPDMVIRVTGCGLTIRLISSFILPHVSVNRNCDEQYSELKHWGRVGGGG